MRARNIKPGFFRDSEILELPLEARFLFVGLWCMADRAGKLEDKPKQIKVEIFGERLNFDCNELLNLLEGRNLIIRYAVNGARFIKVNNFLKHQSPHHTEAQSKIPDPPEIHGEFTVSHGEYPETQVNIPLDSLIPRFADSLIPRSSDSLNSKSKILEVEVLEKDLSKPSVPTSSSLSFSVQDLAKLWNEKAPPELSRVNLPFKRSPKPLAVIKDSLKRNPDQEWWEKVILRMWESPFLRGFNDRGWKADLDFMVRKAEEIIDGKYDQGEGPLPKGFSAIMNFAQRSMANG